MVLWFSEQFFCFLVTQPHNLCCIDRWDNYVNDTSAKMCEEEDLDILRYRWKWRKPRGVLRQLVCGLRFEYRTSRIQSRVLNDQPRRSVRNSLLIDWLRNGFVNLGVRHGKFGEFRQSFKRQRSPVTVAWCVLTLRMDEMACRGNANKQSRVADGVWIIQPVYRSRTNDNSSKRIWCVKCQKESNTQTDSLTALTQRKKIMWANALSYFKTGTTGGILWTHIRGWVKWKP